MAQIAIIGAGVAGLAAARELARAGHAVVVYEKSRGLGGRVTTRRAEGGFAIDHGAQLLKAPSPAVAALVAAIPGAHVIDAPIWTFDGAGQLRPGDPQLDAGAKWTWPGGIAALGRHLGQDLDVRREVAVGALAAAAAPGAPLGVRYAVHDTAGAAVGAADAVLLTAPAPQSAAILASSWLGDVTRRPLLAALEPARYRPCLSVALAYPRRPEVPWYAALNTDRAHPITWLACEHVKPGRAPAGAGLMLAQMSPAWTEAHWDALPKGAYPGGALPAAAAEADALVRGLLGDALGEPLWADAHRWRYALCDAPCGPAAVRGVAGIFVAGDLEAGQGRVHLAIESGWRAALRIAAALA